MASHSIRVLLIGSSPTPYEIPLLERVGRLAGIDFRACYCESSRWDLVAETLPYPTTILRGVKFPPGQAYWHYYLNPGILTLLMRERPDVVVLAGYYTLTSQLALLWCWGTSTPYVIYCESHNISPRRYWVHWLKRFYVGLIVRRAAAYISLGKASRDYLVNYGAQTDAVFTVPNLPDVQWFHAEAKEHRGQSTAHRAQGYGHEVVFDLGSTTDRQHDQSVRFLYVGRLIKVKGLEYLLRALGKLQQSYSKASLTLVGVGPLQRELKALAGDLQLININFIGALPHRTLPRMYASSDVFVLPSVFEPYGTVVTEAMACELPLILSRQVGAASDMLEEGGNGLSVRERDMDDLYRAMKWMVEHPRERFVMGRRSWQIISQWNYDRQVKEFVGAVWRALEKRSTTSHEEHSESDYRSTSH